MHNLPGAERVTKDSAKTISRHSTIQGTNPLFFVVLFGLPLLVGILVGVEPRAILLIPVTLIVATMWLAWPHAILVLVIISSFIHIVEWYPKVLGLNLKPELIVGSLSFAMTVLRSFTHRIQFRVTLIGFCLLSWVFVTALSSANSPDTARSATLSLLILLAILPYFVIVNLVRSVDSFDFAFQVLFWIGVSEGIFGIVAWFVGQAINFSPFAHVGIGGYYVTNGTWMETNIWGDFLVATAMLFVANFAERRLHWWFWPLLGVCVTGVLMSQTRGAWFSLVACFFIMPIVLIVTKVYDSPRGVLKFLGILLGLFVGVALILTFVVSATPDNPFLQRRIATLSSLEYDSTFMLRMRVNLTALSAFWNNGPVVLGNGAKGFQLAGFDVLGVGDDWVGNIFLGALYDSGLLGLMAFSATIFGALWLGVRQARQTSDPKLKAKLAALVLAGFAIVFTGQSNNHSWLALVWIYFGLLSAGINVAREIQEVFE